MCWDYTTLDFDFDFNKYNKISLLTYSAGVTSACLLQDKFPKFDKKVAVNGNPLMTDKKFGISQEIIDLMLNLNLDNCMDFISTFVLLKNASHHTPFLRFSFTDELFSL